MRLTIEDNPGSTRRYDHLEPARGWGVTPCGVRFPGSHRTCTREKDHRGPHVSHGLFKKVLAVWEPGGKRERRPESSAPAPAKKREANRLERPSGRRERPIGLPEPRPQAIVDAMKSYFVRVTASVEELAWLLFLVAFLGFAAYAFKLIYVG
jgi:hypothetical protein